MEKNKTLLILVTYILMITVACEKVPEPPQNLTFKADCFITTKGKENIKMGGVEVVFYDGEMIDFSELHQDITDTISPLGPSITAFVEQHDNDQRADLVKILAWKEIKNEYKNIPQPILETWDEYFNEKAANHKQFIEEYDLLEKAAKALISYDAQFELIYPLISDYEIKRVRTDAEGKLEIKLPIKKSYIVIAQSQRIVSSENNPERYFWILKAKNLNSDNVLDPEIKLQMSNYNLSNMNEEGSEEISEERLLLKFPKLNTYVSNWMDVGKKAILEQVQKQIEKHYP